MNKKIFLIVLTVITIFCIVFGTFHHLGISTKGYSSVSSSIRNGLRHGKFNFHFDDDDFDEDDADDWDGFDFEDDDPKTFDSETISEFRELDVKLKVGGIKIERGNKWEIKSKYSNSLLKPAYSLKNGKLSITQAANNKRSVGNNKCNIVITVPFGTELEKLTIDVNVGAVELGGFDIKKGSIDTNVGAIEITNMGFKDLDLDSDVGAIAIELIEPLENYNITINSDLGGIVVNEKNEKRHFSQKSSSDKHLRIDTNVGGIEVK